MMLKEKSNSWARLKLVLLVPVAACSMLAFARPDVNRELTNLMQSEDTTISPVGQPYTREFFDKEIDRISDRREADSFQARKDLCLWRNIREE